MTSRKCEICGKAIPQARLKVLPNTTYCVKCAEQEVNIDDIPVDSITAAPSEE